MQLESYLRENSISVADFAGQIGVKSRATVYRYAKGIRIPDREMMKRIHDATAGQVTASDFYNLPEKPNGRRKRNEAHHA